jgi:hypothetical protein
MRARSGRRLVLLHGLCFLMAGGLGMMAAAPSIAQVSGDEVAVLERRVKAVFVFKFAAFVDWPLEVLAETGAAIQIAVMGEEAVVQDIADAAGSRTVEGRRVQARRVGPGDPLDGVHILFMRDAAFRGMGGSVEQLRPEAMLIITESPGALGQGSVVNFVVDDGKVRFDISLDAAERRGLRLSSRLITVARTVVGKQR